MKFHLPAWPVAAGICFACGRTTRTRGARVCPYCGERVYRSRRAQTAAWLSLALPAAASAAVLLSGGVRSLIASFPSRAGIAASGLAAVGAALPLLPVDTADLVVSTSREVWKWQAASFFGGLFTALAAFTLAAAFNAAASPARVLAVTAFPFVLMIPVYWRVSFSALLSPVLFYAAFRLG
ncbi:MAG: hypothetical protein J6Z49_09810 [Kiritimatiellae bacterium]|nr:hypothetical protein [Kiritimatiellia bacterium]